MPELVKISNRSRRQRSPARAAWPLDLAQQRNHRGQIWLLDQLRAMPGGLDPGRLRMRIPWLASTGRELDGHGL